MTGYYGSMEQQPAGYGDGMTVYILTREWAYEGECILAVASTLESARASIPYEDPGTQADCYNIHAAVLDAGEPELVEINYSRWDYASGRHHLEGWRPA